MNRRAEARLVLGLTVLMALQYESRPSMSHEVVHFDTDGNALFDITPLIRGVIKASGVADGIAVLWIPHTTAAIAVASFPDPKGLEDVMDELDRIVPTRIDFKHQYDTPQDAAAHIKSALIGVSLTILVERSDLLLGHSQGIFLLELDGPRPREIYIRVSNDGP
jgi:secondary thiamine-phosphate synthase enzyme